jgi:hypothetical protein
MEVTAHPRCAAALQMRLPVWCVSCDLCRCGGLLGILFTEETVATADYELLFRC